MSFVSTIESILLIAFEKEQDKKRQAAKSVANDVFENLRKCQEISVAKVLIGGSVGKKTAVNEDLFEIDLDLVVFINKTKKDEKQKEMKTPYEMEDEVTILKICKSQLTKIKGFKSSKPINRNVLQFSLPVSANEWTKRVEFDLVIATNFGDDGVNQVAYTMMEIRENPSIEAIHLGEANLSFEILEVMKKLLTKDSIRDVVRISKLWDKTLKKRNKKWGYVGGRSYLIELIAIHANNDALDNSVYQGFVAFLKLMARLKTIEVVFTVNYKRSQISSEILNGPRPIVMDPVNYYHNVAERIDQKDICRYQSYASNTLRFIELYEKIKNCSIAVDNFEEIVGF